MPTVNGTYIDFNFAELVGDVPVCSPCIKRVDANFPGCTADQVYEDIDGDEATLTKLFRTPDTIEHTSDNIGHIEDGIENDGELSMKWCALTWPQVQTEIGKTPTALFI